ncbi:hypothetical protein PBI_GRAYSON_21 [Rhodococcus phage Grayson]|nr:hypothetical protein PBI_GRAYSON_21 [Rhodococcus phage Grayson]
MISKVDLKEEVLRLAAEKPDFIYESDPNAEESCAYLAWDDDKAYGSCIMGQALMNLGVDPVELSKYEGSDISAVVSALNDNEPPHYHRDPFDFWLSYVQGRQDAGYTWSKAVEFANEMECSD